MFGTSRRHEIALSGVGFMIGAYSGGSGAGKGNGDSIPGAVREVETRASCAALRCAKLRAANKKKKTLPNLIGLGIDKC
jgi:hypothetical protein